MLVNVARAKAQHEIAGVQHVSDISMHPFQTRLVTHAPMTVRHNFIRDGLTADFGNRRLTCRVNIRYHDAISIIERASEFFAQRFRS